VILSAVRELRVQNTGEKLRKLSNAAGDEENLRLILPDLMALRTDGGRRVRSLFLDGSYSTRISFLRFFRRRFSPSPPPPRNAATIAGPCPPIWMEQSQVCIARDLGSAPPHPRRTRPPTIHSRRGAVGSSQVMQPNPAKRRIAMFGRITRLVAKERADRHAPPASYSCVRLLGELSTPSGPLLRGGPAWVENCRYEASRSDERVQRPLAGTKVSA